MVCIPSQQLLTEVSLQNSCTEVLKPLLLSVQESAPPLVSIFNVCFMSIYLSYVEDNLASLTNMNRRKHWWHVMLNITLVSVQMSPDATADIVALGNNVTWFGNRFGTIICGKDSSLCIVQSIAARRQLLQFGEQSVPSILIHDICNDGPQN